MSNRGKDVLRGQLMYRRKGASSFKKRVVTAYCGTGAGANGKHAVAQLTLNEDYEKVEKPGQKPKNMILLEAASIDCSYTNSYSNVNAGRLSASPSPSPHSSSQSGSGSGIITGSGSGSGTIGSMHPFNVITKNGDIHEFLSESENDRLRWVKLLQLLIMFPYSTIPDEPTNKPIKESLRSQLDPKRYGADSVWPVYILPEEVGSRLSIIGTNVVALKSGGNGKIGHLDIYNPGDPSTPLISWDRDKMRRTGKTGHLVFIEIGRRCQGGPGLVWMYTGFNDAQALRETLHNFLFKGDGRAVAIPTQSSPPIYDVPRSSLDTTLPPSYKRHNSIPGYNNHVLSRSRSHDHDSGYPPSPISSMNTPPQLDGPPVRLDKHPSIRRKSGPRDLSRSNSTTSFGSLSEREIHYAGGSRSRDSAIEDGEGSGDSRSNSPQDEDVGVIGQMDPDQLPSGNGAGAPYYDSVPRRTYSDGAVANGHQRVVLPGGGDPAHYEQMVHPRNTGMQGYDGYVFMKPAESGGSRAISAPIPVASRNVAVVGDDTYHHLQRRPSPQNNSASPRSRQNYDQLPTISEGHRSNYENHPLPRDLKGVSVEYRPSYENVEKARQDRRGSMNMDQYENVDGEQSTGQNSNANNGNSGGQKKRLSLRRRSSEKEVVGRRDVVSPMTPNGGASDIEGYVVIQSKSESGDVNSTVPAVGYASLNYQSTDVVGAMRTERRLHSEQYHRSQVVSSEN